MVVQLPDGTVEFTFICPHATRVLIAGDFNGWQPNFAMTRLDGQRWRSRLRLGPGVYQFRYCADGQWFNDYAAFGLEHGPFGLNSVVKVERAKRRPPARSGGPAARNTHEATETRAGAVPHAVSPSPATPDKGDHGDWRAIYHIGSTTTAAAS